MPQLTICASCQCMTKTICGKCRAEKNLDGHLAMLNSLTGMALEQQKTQLLAEVIKRVEGLKYSEPLLLGTPETTERVVKAVNQALDDVISMVKDLSVTAVPQPEKTSGTRKDLYGNGKLG